MNQLSVSPEPIVRAEELLLRLEGHLSDTRTAHLYTKIKNLVADILEKGSINPDSFARLEAVVFLVELSPEMQRVYLTNLYEDLRRQLEDIKHKVDFKIITNTGLSIPFTGKPCLKVVV